MTTRSHLWDNQWQRPPGRLGVQDQALGRWGARRMSRRFAGVGVQIPAARLRAITAGAPLVSDEFVDINFAFAATEMKREQRLAKVKRSRRRAMRWLLVAGLFVAALNLLICMAYTFITLALHQTPM